MSDVSNKIFHGAPWNDPSKASIMLDIEDVKKKMMAATGIEPTYLIVGPHSGQRAFLEPRHMLTRVACRTKWGRMYVRGVVATMRYGADKKMAVAIWRLMTPAARVFPPVTRMPLP